LRLFRPHSHSSTAITTPHSILFVCRGNLCRSPACSAVFQKLLGIFEIHQPLSVDSAGILGDWAGSKPAARMRTAGARKGYRIEGRARRINRKELNRAGTVIAVDRSTLRELRHIHSRPVCDLFLFSDFLPGEYPRDLPDPFGESLEFHLDVLGIIERGCSRLLNDLIIPRFLKPQWMTAGSAYQSLLTPDNRQFITARQSG
jgi:protein-tyrosine phosphatase